MKQGDPVSAPRCQALSSQKPLPSRNAVQGGQGQGLGMMFLDDYKINAASWPVHKVQRPKRPHKALASSIQVVPKLAP